MRLELWWIPQRPCERAFACSCTSHDSSYENLSRLSPLLSVLSILHSCTGHPNNLADAAMALRVSPSDRFVTPM